MYLSPGQIVIADYRHFILAARRRVQVSYTASKLKFDSTYVTDIRQHNFGGDHDRAMQLQPSE